MLKIFAALFYFECIIRLRKLSEWLYPLAFFAVMMLLFPILFSPDVQIMQRYCAGFIWLATLFAIFLSTTPIFNAECEDSNLEQAYLSRLSFTMIILAKLTAQWILTAGPIIVLSPAIACCFHLPSEAWLPLILSLCLGTPIIILIGSLGVALTSGLRHQGVLLGLMMFPLIIPVLIFGVNIVTESQAHLSFTGGLLFLAGISVFAVTVLPALIAATIRISLDE